MKKYDFNKNNIDDREEIKEIGKKIWYKSKTIITNIFIAVVSFIGFFLEETKDIVNSNLDYFKSSGIDVKYIFILLIFIALVNIYLRFKTKTKIITKQE